jgi:hypothetical protein
MELQGGPPYNSPPIIPRSDKCSTVVSPFFVAFGGIGSPILSPNPEFLRPPHLWHPRQIQEHQRIHNSVFGNDGYTPKALLPAGKDWKNKSTFDNVLEVDMHGDIGDLERELAAYTLGEA